ncbi:MAG TPA: GGDEF domain-containing protein [Gemmatimonadales bacterium]|nr:GGDEF domain-containing protein [Gemmatimonadales bacterium]
MTALLRRSLGPEAILFLAALVLALWPGLDQRAARAIAWSPYAAGMASGLIAWRLRRSRLVFAAAIILAAHALTTRWASGDAVAFQLAALLLPLNLAAVALLPERGVFTSAGLAHWVALASQAAALYVAVELEARDLAAPAVVVALGAGGTILDTPLGGPALAAFGMAAALVAAGHWLASLTTGRGYLWALGAALMAFHVGPDATDRAIWVTGAIAMLATGAIELSYVLAYHDGLTGLPGRRALDEALARLDGRYTVAMVDVDHFKQCNDRHGHDVGDQVLRTVATRLRDALGDGRVYRYGGEEFAVLLPQTPLTDALPQLEAARAAVAGEPFSLRARVRPRKKPTRPRSGHRPTQETLTVSIGAAESAGSRTAFEQIVRAADQALYRAKEGGRNQVRS